VTHLPLALLVDGGEEIRNTPINPLSLGERVRVRGR